MKKSRLRLTTVGPALIVLILALAFGALIAIFSRLGEENAHRSVHAFSVPIINASARSLFNPLYKLNVVQIEAILSQYVDRKTIIFAAVYNKQGQRVSEVSGGWVPNRMISEGLARRAVNENTQIERTETDYLILINPIVSGNQVVGAVEFIFNQDELSAAFRDGQVQIVNLTIAIMLVTVVLFFFLIRTALLPLSVLALSARKIGEGNFDVPIPIRGSYEIASVAESLEAMRAELLKGYKNLQEVMAELEQRVTERTAVAEAARAESESARANLETQFWLANGQTRIADAIRGEQTVSQLSENVLLHLCRYVGAEAGALFVLKEKTLTLAGTYAYTARPGFDGAIALGEGLVGQAAVDGKALYTDVPSDTLIISTGLTDIKPRQIAAAPFFMNGKVVGVLELVTLSEFTESHLELWSRISETLGAAFHTVQTRQRLAELLAASQQQAEELQAQEEELRAANEELQAQSENLKVVRELKAQKDEK